MVIKRQKNSDQEPKRKTVKHNIEIEMPAPEIIVKMKRDEMMTFVDDKIRIVGNALRNYYVDLHRQLKKEQKESKKQ